MLPNVAILESGGGCFPSMATVEGENGKSVALSELQVGDRVKTGFNVKIVLYILIFKKILRQTL